MQRRFLAILAAALLAAPMALASHNYPLGSPRNWCESDTDDDSHEYGPSTGTRIFGHMDGNVHTMCYSEFSNFDGHFDFAYGGARLYAAYSIGCNDGERIDHEVFPTVRVEDYYLAPLGASVSFSVHTDTLNNLPPLDPNQPDCGDGEVDYGVDCVDGCVVGFPPGLDGTYHVYVNGVTGAVHAGAGVATPDHGERILTVLDLGHNPLPPVCPEGLCVEVPDTSGDPGTDPRVPNPVEEDVPLPSEEDSTEACGNLHVHGSWRGSYFYGTTQVHLHHCSGSPHWNGRVAYSHPSGDRPPGLSYWGHDAVSVYYNDYKYHRPCIWMQQQYSTWVGPACYWQYN